MTQKGLKVGWDLGACHETTRGAGTKGRGTFIHLQPSVIIQDLHWAGPDTCRHVKEGILSRNNNEDVVGGGRCILEEVLMPGKVNIPASHDISVC